MRAYDGQRTPWVFHHVRDRRRAKAGERIGSLRRGFNAAVERAELPSDLHQHDLRHRRVTTWLAEGQSPVKVKEAVGHADLRTTMGYTSLVKSHLEDLKTPSGKNPLEALAELVGSKDGRDFLASLLESGGGEEELKELVR